MLPFFLDRFCFLNAQNNKYEFSTINIMSIDSFICNHEPFFAIAGLRSIIFVPTSKISIIVRKLNTPKILASVKSCILKDKIFIKVKSNIAQLKAKSKWDI
jgi:hypothetical protein